MVSCDAEKVARSDTHSHRGMNSAQASSTKPFSRILRPAFLFFFFFLNDLSLTSHTAPPSKLSNLLTVGCVMQQLLGTFNFTATHAVPE